MATTLKGFPYPVAADLFDVPGDMQALAEAVDATPGVAILTRTARLALAGNALWDGRVVFDTDWDQWLGWSAARSRWEFLADRITISTGVSTAIAASPVGLLNTTDLYAGLTIRNRNTADPAATVEWVVTDLSPVTYREVGGRAGLPQIASQPNDQASISTEVDITGLSVTFTAVSTHHYRTTLYLPLTGQSTADAQVTVAIADAANTHVQQAIFDRQAAAAANESNVTVTVVETGLSGSTTRKARAASSAGTFATNNASVRPAQIVVEDLGAG